MSSIIVDTHVDVPYRLMARPQDISEATDSGDFDYPRALAGGLNAPFMSIYTPAEYEALGKSRETAHELIDLVENIVAASPDKFAIATSVTDVREQFAAGLMSLPMGMENGSPIAGDLVNLIDDLHRLQLVRNCQVAAGEVQGGQAAKRRGQFFGRQWKKDVFARQAGLVEPIVVHERRAGMHHGPAHDTDQVVGLICHASSSLAAK